MRKGIMTCFNCIYCQYEAREQEIKQQKKEFQIYISGRDTFFCEAIGKKLEMSDIHKLNCKKLYHYNRGQSFQEYFSEEARKREFRHNMKYKILWGSAGAAIGAIISFLIKVL